MPTDYAAERAFFDRVAARTEPTPMPRATLERYAAPRWPHLFGKEMMFARAGNLRGKRVLEVGCGEGVASVQLAYAGADVTGVDLSGVSVAAARRRAALNGVAARFEVCDVVAADTLGTNEYDVVWCDLILHHLVDSLDAVLAKVRAALRPGGVFVCREPVAYAGWLKAVRRAVPVRVDATDDEQPFRASELAAVRRAFPGVRSRYFRVLGRLDRVTGNLFALRQLARLDNVLLKLPAARPLAGNVVLWATKETG